MKTKLGFLGASTLVNDVLMQIAKLAEGNYQAADYCSLP